MNAQETNDRLAHLRQVLGDDLSYRLIAIGRDVAGTWTTPTDATNKLSRLVELATAVRAAGLEEEMRRVAGEWSSRRQKLVDPLALVGGAPILEVIDAQIGELTQLRKKLAQPAPRRTVGAPTA